jgi:hypothetical protein
MPRGDQTGPRGMGPMTGRAAGFCSGAGMPGYANSAPGRGYGVGFGRGRGAGGGGRGWRNGYYATGLPGWVRWGRNPSGNVGPAPEAEKQMLMAQTQVLQTELEGLRRRLEELEAAPPKE